MGWGLRVRPRGLRALLFSHGGFVLKRVLTGIVLIPLVIYVVLYAPALWTLAAVLLLTLLASMEFNSLTLAGKRDRLTDSIGIVSSLLIPVFIYLCGKDSVLPVLMATVFIVFLVGIAGGRDLKDAYMDTALKALGMVYIALPLSYIVLIRKLDGGSMWILFLLVIIWCNDTFAYAAGKTIGSKKLTPVSPKKTVEGAVAGILGGVIAAVLFNKYLSMGLSSQSAVLLSLLVGPVGIIGDIAESLIKRAVGVKDSGTLLPGHGGILDRIDSLIFTVPLLYYFLLWRVQCPA